MVKKSKPQTRAVIFLKCDYKQNNRAVNFLKYKIKTSYRTVILYKLDHTNKTRAVIFSHQKINTSDPCGYFFKSLNCKGEYLWIIFESAIIEE